MQVDMQAQRLPVPAEAPKSVSETAPGASVGKAGVNADSKTVSLSEARAQKVNGREEAKPTENDVQEAVKRLSDYVQSAKRDLLFSVDDETGRTVIQVLDSETKEVVRQIPPDEILALARHMVESEDTGGLLKLQV